MTEKGLPDWTTELDEEILKLLNTELTLTPSVIAENIDRSRGAVSRRLNALEAGGLVNKVSRGKYSITPEALQMLPGGWKLVELPEEEIEQAAKEDYERQKIIEETLGISEDQFLNDFYAEYDKLRQDWKGSEDDLLQKAFDNVKQKYRKKDE